MPESPEMTALEAQVTATDGVIDSAVTLLTGLVPLIEAAAGDKAASLALAADLKAKTDGLAAAVAAVPAPAPPPA